MAKEMAVNKQGEIMKEFYYTIKVTGYIEAKSKKKALKKVKEYKEHFMCDDPYPIIKVKEL